MKSVFCTRPALPRRLGIQLDTLIKQDGGSLVELKRGQTMFGVPKMIVVQALRDALDWGLKYGHLLATSALDDRARKQAYGAASPDSLTSALEITSTMRTLGSIKNASTKNLSRKIFPPLPKRGGSRESWNADAIQRIMSTLRGRGQELLVAEGLSSSEAAAQLTSGLNGAYCRSITAGLANRALELCKSPSECQARPGEVRAGRS